MERLESLLSRKFLFAILVTVLSFILVILKQVTPEQWLQFVAVIGTGYVLTNTASKFANNK